MPTPMIYNSIASADMHVVEMIDPALIRFYAESLASQVNDFRMGYKPQKRMRDLADWVSDIVIETTAQGASLLEVHIIDPAWTLFMRDKNGVCFIDVDDTGYLWPPIEVVYPKNISSATWRLAQCRPSTDLNQANVILVFEDKIVAELREHYGAQTSYPNQTRAEFIQSLVQQANTSPAYPGETKIRFKPLLPAATFTVQDLSLSQQIPTSATQPFAPPARKDANKPPAKTTTGGIPVLTPVQQAVQGVEISIAEGVTALSGQLTSPFLPGWKPPSPITGLPPGGGGRPVGP